MEFLEWPSQASRFAADVDQVFVRLTVVSCSAVVLIVGLIVAFCIRYSRRKQPQPEQLKINHWPLEIAWSLGSLVFFLCAAVWGARLYLRMFQNPPDKAYTVYAIGKQWMWKFQHPDGRREINELHLPVDQPVKLAMISQDVIHSLYFPAFRIKHDVLPMAYSTMWFEPSLPGVYHLFCAEYCGTSHSEMIGRIVIMKPTDFQTWQGKAQGMSEAAQAGAKLVNSLSCASCHKTTHSTLAPQFGGLWGSTVELADGSKVVVDEAYLRESILNPEAKVVRNFQPIMPSYQGRITEDEILSIIAYIKSLGEQPDE